MDTGRAIYEAQSPAITSSDDTFPRIEPRIHKTAENSLRPSHNENLDDGKDRAHVNTSIVDELQNALADTVLGQQKGSGKKLHPDGTELGIESLQDNVGIYPHALLLLVLLADDFLERDSR